MKKIKLLGSLFIFLFVLNVRGSTPANADNSDFTNVVDSSEDNSTPAEDGLAHCYCLHEQTTLIEDVSTPPPPPPPPPCNGSGC